MSVSTPMDTKAPVPEGAPETEEHGGGLGGGALTPLLDTLFLLLFALLATSRASSAAAEAEHEELQIQLPELGEGGTAADGLSDVRVVSVGADGLVRLLGEDGTQQDISTPEDLVQRLEDQLGKAASNGGRLRVEVRADSEARHGVVVAVLGAVRASGAVDVSFVAEASQAASEGRPFGASFSEEGSR